MLGRVRRTTRTDVGLALSLAGVVYLFWAGSVACARMVTQQLLVIAQYERLGLTGLAAALTGTFTGWSAAFDAAGLLWLVLTLLLIIGSSRQRLIISWPWGSAICQALVGGLLAIWSALAAIGPRAYGPEVAAPAAVSWTGLSVAAVAALLLWVTALVWLVYERARLRMGPSIHDSFRTHG